MVVLAGKVTDEWTQVGSTSLSSLDLLPTSFNLATAPHLHASTT